MLANNITGKNIYRVQWRWASNSQILQSKGCGAPILIREKKNSEKIYGVLKIRSQSRHSKEIDVERNHGERLFRKLLPTFYWVHAVGKHTLGTYG